MLADRPLRLATVLVATLALTACGETVRTKPSSHATPRPVASVPATVNPAPTTPPPPAESGATAQPTASATKAAGNAVTAAASNKFEPATLTVKKGTKVTWTSQGAHSVTSGTAAGGQDAKGPMKSELPFTTYSVTFDKAGTYKYFCIPHASLGMEGEIVVT